MDDDRAVDDAPSPERSHARRRVALALWITGTFPGVLISCAMLSVARTLEGRAAALFALAMIASAATAIAKRIRASVGLLAAALLCGVFLLARSNAITVPSSAVRLEYVGPRATRPWRIAPTHVVPERDQLALATVLVPMVDALMTRQSAARLRGALDAVYDDVDRDPSLKSLPSAMGDAILDRDSGRVFVFEPPHARGERRPAILFLHGSAGSWKGYFAELYAIARANRWALAQPSFGFGNWNIHGGLDAVESARAWLVSQPWVDPTRVHLVCLSNGGRAATRIVATTERRYRSIVWLSSVIERSVLDDHPWHPSWNAAPMLVLHGANDERIPLEYVTRAVESLSASGAEVERELFAGEDHYLVFTQRARVRAAIARWVARW